MPSKPERNRLRIYRRLQKEGTLSLKDGVHILPFNDDRYEFFQWLSQEVKTLGGEMQFVVVEKLETMQNYEIVALFKTQAENSYLELQEKIASFSIDSEKEFESRQILKKIIRDFETLYSIDYFHSMMGKHLKTALQTLQRMVEPILPDVGIAQYNRNDFQGKKWQTRPKPFVDRMASAWLIQKFIDPYAQFIFSPTIDAAESEVITYDMNHATFTHIGELCTFEVLVRAFSIEDEKVAHIAKIIHNLDLNDDKYVVPEAHGIRMILSAIRQKLQIDEEILIHSHAIFDDLYMMV